MNRPLPSVLVPALLASARLYAHQFPALWRLGPVMIADHTRHDSMGALAAGILAAAPPQFALIGLSMGGYVAFEILRRAPERVLKLALLDTSPYPDTAQQSEARRTQIARAEAGGLSEVVDAAFPRHVHPRLHADEALRALFQQMAAEVGVAGFVRQQRANAGRADSRPGLAAIRCPTLVLVGDHNELTPPERAVEMASCIAGSRIATVPQSGHCCALEQPDYVTRQLLSFLTDTR